MTKYIRILLVFSLLLTAIPCAVFVKNDKLKTKDGEENFNFSLPETVRILNEADSTLSEIPLNDYLVGCVMAQMPCDFEIEALKCQAIIARTYVLYHQYHNKMLSENPQSYFSQEKAKESYGESYQTALERAADAVKQTEGIVLTYKNTPIVTAFHPVSSGYTENAKDMWGTHFPYLLSVESPYDNSEKWTQTLKITTDEFYSRLCAYAEIENPQSPTASIKKKTSHGTALTVEISSGDIKKEIAGTEFAEIFGLNSCNFSINTDNDKCVITCHGGGHLVGLSQWGANQMALSGDSCSQILCHYFTNVFLSQIK